MRYFYYLLFPLLMSCGGDIPQTDETQNDIEVKNTENRSEDNKENIPTNGITEDPQYGGGVTIDRNGVKE